MSKSIYSSINKFLIKLPLPINISYWWNFGSLLGLFILIQIISGILLSIHYCPNIELAFPRIIHIIQNVNQGWLIHNIHINGASIFFICIYIHMGRGIYYHSFNLYNTWIIGVSIFILSIATAFLGYVLPWGQISFWGATVITNLVTTIPFVGKIIVEWIWGGFSIRNATLNRFFSLHFISPFIILIIVILHLIFLHKSGSKNPLGVKRDINKIIFHPLFTIKDILGFIIFMIIFTIINLQYPYLYRDPDNFRQANPLVTPSHIQPEWYFLFAYAILRSIPNKLGGVLALLRSILIIYSLKWHKTIIRRNKFYPLRQIRFWLFVNIFLILTFLGAQLIEYPFINIRQILSTLYFTFFPIYFILPIIWNSIIYPSMK